MRALIRVTVVLMAIVALVVVTACQPAAPKSVTPVKVAFSAKDAHYGPYLVAIEKGYFAEEGIDFQILETSGNVGIAAVLAGDAEFTTSAGSALSAILKGGEMKIIFSLMDRPNYEVWSSQPDIKTLNDLSGKAVGIIGRGDSMEISARLVLAAAGLDPNGVAYTAMGPGNARLAAIQSGAVAAAVLSLTDVEKLRQDGPKGHLLVDVGRDVRMLFNGLAVSDRFMKEKPDVVAGFLRATVKGREFFKQHKDESLEIVGKYNGQSREINEPVYQSVLAGMTDDGTLSADVQRADATVRAAIVGAEKVRPIEEIYDYSIVRKIGGEIASSGWKPVP
jgi:NitT/TauT family transport system substrate-binding protein